MTDQQPRRPADWDELYPGRFMKAGQLGDKKHVFTIKDVILEELEGDKGKQDKGIILFEETPFALALNKTNGECLKAMFSRAVMEWRGKRIALYRAEVETGSMKGQPCIRIYGSPELKQDMHIQIKFPRKKAFPVTLYAPKQKQAPERNEGNGQQQGG